MFGDPEGKMTPMAALQLSLSGYKDQRLLSQPMITDMILDDDKCNAQDLEHYIGNWTQWFDRHSPKGHPPSCSNQTKCCGYFSSLIHKHWNMSTLAMSYAVPHVRVDHLALLEYLGLNDTKGMKYQAPIYNLAPVCELPTSIHEDLCIGKLMEAFELVYSSRGLCVGFNSPSTEEMYKVMFCLLFHLV